MRGQLSSWPALAGQEFPTLLAYERGVWGKAHGAASDFRWLARSSGLEPAAEGLRLGLGPEDRSERATFWQALGARCTAGVFYPSRAMDAAGRQGSLEKQVLVWRRPAALPAALGALALLPQAAPLDDGIWWERRADPGWAEPGFVLPIDPHDLLPVELREEEAERAVAAGIAALAESVDPVSLAGLYSDLLSGRRPACLRGLARPLSAESLAALLLPLPPDLANRLSLAAWVPSSRLSPAEVGGWDLLVLPPAFAGPVPPSGEPDPRGADLARALLAGDPEALRKPSPSPPSTEVSPVAEVETSLPAARAPAPLRPVFRLPLTCPPESSLPVVLALFDFAADPARRWLGSLPGLEPLPAGDPAERVLAGWIAELGALRGDADREQWGVKLDLLRSAALALVPTAETLDRIGKPAGDRIPPLLFSAASGRRGYELLGRLGEEALRRVLTASLSCKTDTLRRQVCGWLARAMAEGRLPQTVQRLIRDVMAQHPES